MIHRLLLVLVIFFGALISHAQSELLPCGTPPVKSKWLKAYQANPDAYEKNEGVLLYVPLTIHVTGTDAGTGYMPLSEILEGMCRLNLDFEVADLQFFIEGDINYINSSAWHFHEDIFAGTDMMNANNVDNTINSYFVNTAAGNAGYNLPHADGTVMRRASVGPLDHTWAHEIGHNLSVQHTFLGWEGGVWHDGSVVHSYFDPAPTTVLYDYTLFQDTLILDTMIIDTAIVELVDGSNCAVAADGFCDTPADYLGFRWQCAADSTSLQTQTDPNGVQFNSEGRYIMSYSFDNCQATFSPEQVGAMRANLMDEKPGHLANQSPIANVIDEDANLVSPIQNGTSQFNNTELVWNSVPGATNYIVQVNRLPNFSGTFMVVEAMTTDTTYSMTEGLLEGLTYYWRVLPYNQGYVCATFSDGESFVASNLVGIKPIPQLEGFSIYPNLVSSGQHFTLETNSLEPFAANFSLYAVDGRQVLERSLDIPQGLFREQIAGASLSAGVYFGVLESEQGLARAKIVVMD
ncbi:MAG: hypothetical protein AAF502_06090 [Bacteroidota bacterium]